MAQYKEVEMTINVDGTVEIDLQGFQGKGCSQVAEQLAKAIGTTVKRDKKCEYHQAEQKQQQKQRNARI